MPVPVSAGLQSPRTRRSVTVVAGASPSVSVFVTGANGVALVAEWQRARSTCAADGAAASRTTIAANPSERSTANPLVGACLQREMAVKPKCGSRAPNGGGIDATRSVLAEESPARGHVARALGLAARHVDRAGRVDRAEGERRRAAAPGSVVADGDVGRRRGHDARGRADLLDRLGDRRRSGFVGLAAGDEVL